MVRNSNKALKTVSSKNGAFKFAQNELKRHIKLSFLVISTL